MDPPAEPFLEKEGGSEDDAIDLSKPSMTMGRQGGNDVVVAEPGVSRKHAEIVKSNSGHHLRDLASTNGTFVNDEKLPAGDHPLKDGDKIRLGASTSSFVYHMPAASTVQVTLSDMDMVTAEAQDTWMGEVRQEAHRLNVLGVEPGQE